MKNIIYIGQFKDASGYGNAARGYLRLLDSNLDSNKITLKVIPLNFEKSDFSNEEDKVILNKYVLDDYLSFIENNKYTLLLHGLPNFSNIDIVKKLLSHRNCQQKINAIAWETDNFPKMWKEIYDQNVFDKLLVSCSWNKQCLEKKINIPVIHVSYPIYDTYNLNKKTNNKFNIFSMSQWSHRKGFDILLRAYYQEFFNQEDVELFIKTYRNETLPGVNEASEKEIIVNEILTIKNSIRNYNELPKCKVNLKTGFVNTAEIKSYYEKADVFCSPTRGEGFGMTIAQAALSGIPCIVPNLGGHTDYLDPKSTYWIDSKYAPVYDIKSNFYSSIEMNFIEPDVSNTRLQLRKSYNDWKANNLKAIGEKTKNYCANKLSEQLIFNNLLEAINENSIP